MTCELADLRALLERLRAMADDGLARCAALTSAPSEPTPIYMTIPEYADRRRVSESTIRRWIAHGLPHYRRGKVIRVRVAEADVWDDNTTVKRMAEIDAHARGNAR
jgi:excisionase family DNA binding protein